MRAQISKAACAQSSVIRLIEAVGEPLTAYFKRAELRRQELALGMAIGAEACLTLKDVCRGSDKQIVETDRQDGWPLQRPPYLFEPSLPQCLRWVFAVGGVPAMA